jgi:RHS repeat-associated protein
MSEFGFDAQVPSLPQGGGAISGLGETYTPDLSTGTGTYSIRLDTPNGPNDIGPRLALRYDTGTGNGPFGLGFSLPLPRLLRSTSQRFPKYDDSDRLVLEGAGELVRLPEGGLRPQVDGGAWRAEQLDAGFRLTDHTGQYYFAGTTPAARLSDANGQRVYAWHLERIEDPLGNIARFEWLRDGLQLYLASLSYGQYELTFQYEKRPDPVLWGRAGFLITTALRCSSIELGLPGAAQPVLRRWSLEYIQDPGNGGSLLSKITLIGFDEHNQPLSAPPLSLGFTTPGKPAVHDFDVDEALEGSAPPGLTQPYSGRTELVDWDGNGLPDILSIDPGGTYKVWRNRGNFHWRIPHLAADKLPMFTDPQAPVALMDMDGNGVADLVRLDRFDGYTPRLPQVGFNPPRAWSQVPPSLKPLDPGTRMVDLDGNGIVDLIESSDQGFNLYYRDEATGFSAVQKVSGAQAPAASFADPFVLLADMTGDGTQDLVKITAGSVSYWPYLGNGRWHDPDSPLQMGRPEGLPANPQRERLFLSDIDGDGCADLLYLDIENLQVLYWLNQSGQRFSNMQAVTGLFIPDPGAMRLADMSGLGTAGLLWYQPAKSRYRYLDFNGGVKPHLLNRIDNGVGLLTEVEYSTSTLQALADPAWSTFLPFPVPVVSRLTSREQTTQRVSIREFHYHEGRYDGRLREFAGFGRVDEDQLSDEASPTLRTTSWYHNGILSDQTEVLLTLTERQRQRAIRGRMYRQERYGLDGSPVQDLPYDRQEQEWVVTEEALDSNPNQPSERIYIPRLQRSIRTTFERQSEPVGSITTENQAWDEFGNVTRSVETSLVAGRPELRRTLRTESEYARDPSGRFRQRVWRTRQVDGDNNVLADTITLYDNAPEGSLALQGLVTRRLSLAITDRQVEEAYGTNPPDFAALGYFRREDSSGWWFVQAAYQRIEDANGLRGRVTGPNGAVSEFEFDAFRTYPVRLSDPTGNTTLADYDYRACRTARLVDPGGVQKTATFDALARPLAVIQPGDSLELPTSQFIYITSSLPVQAALQRRAISGRSQTIDSREFFDGENRLLERRERDQVGEVVVASQVYSGRGLLARSFRSFRPPSAEYQPPSLDLPHAQYAYDALGRMTSQVNPDGSKRRLLYEPLLLEEWDEEDVRDDPDAVHQETPTRTHLDITGRVLAIDENLSGRWITSTYEYDVKGNLLAHTDAIGNIVRTWFDCLGRPLRVERPESSTVTVYDAASNPVESRNRAGQSVLRTFDRCNRLVAVRHNTPSSEPVARLSYHDSSMPASMSPGQNTSGGRLIKMEHQAGEVHFDYDEHGRLARKNFRLSSDDRDFAIDYSYRADGQFDSLTYPAQSPGAPRQVVRYEYNPRGQLSRIAGLIRKIEHDEAGRRTLVDFANRLSQSYRYDPRTGRLVEMQLSDPNGLLRATQYHYDQLGNLTQVESPDPGLATGYAYDDLYRLVEASTRSGESWTYRYDDVGNLLHKSDVGEYRYGEAGAPATCLTSAGGNSFSYTQAGQISQAPWGQAGFDPAGRMIHLETPDGLIEFAYDSIGMRVSEKYTHPQPGQPALRLTPDPLFTIEDGKLIYNFSDGAGICARQAAGGELVFQHSDHLGSLVLVSGSDGRVIERLRYDPYGALLERTGEAISSPYAYTGGALEPGSGLLYLNARYYHPKIGRFVSPDAIIQDLHDPMAWSAYVYCRANPLGFVDPSGEGFLEALVAVVAIVALAVVAVATLGVGLALLGVGLAMVAGGVVGGLAAAKKGGNFGDILTGALVGAAVGGWAAFGALYAGGALASGLGIGGQWGTILAGSVNGAVNGTATGFSAGFAGGKGSLDEILNQMWAGALAGAMTGSLLAKWSMQQPQTLDQLKANLKEAVKPITQPPSLSSVALDQSQVSTWVNSVQKIPSNVTSVLRDYALSQLTPYLSQSAVQTLVVDSMVGAKLLGYKNPFESDFSEAMWEKEIGGPLRRDAPGLASQKLLPLLL